jgi:membrane protease YdiL (CAAX protease family)
MMSAAGQSSEHQGPVLNRDSDAPGHVWLLSSGSPRNAATVPPGVEYHRVLAGDRRRVGRGMFAILLSLAGIVIFPVVILRVLGLVDQQFGNTTPIFGGTDYTPLYHTGSMLSLGLLVPWNMFIQRWLYRIPGPSLHSVISRFRFDLFGKALVVFGPIWVLANTTGAFVPVTEVPWSRFELLGILIATLLLTPLQAMGEEYGGRGLMFRVIGSWTRNPRAGLIAGVIGSSVIFTAIHGSTDIYINIWYFVLWSCLAVITWRTGGLEVAVVLHAVLNTFVLLTAPLLRVDLGGALADRSAGVGQVTLLIPTAVVIFITGIVWWWTRRTGPARTPRTARSCQDRCDLDQPQQDEWSFDNVDE